MALAVEFLDQVRARTSLSGLIGATVKLSGSGRERKGCCPFHNEKTPSFTVNDDKGFYHCFGCGAHGDAIRWLIERDGLPFIDAVRHLADAAGLAMPAPSPEAAQRAAVIEGQRPTLEAAADIYAEALGFAAAGKVRAWLDARGIGADLVAAFGLGWASDDGALRGRGFGQRDLISVGLVGVSEQRGGPTPFAYPRFRSRVMVPIHDARGRLVGFGGRAGPGAPDKAAKWVNSPDCAIFDKGATLYNLHRAAAPARAARRLVVVEGYFDVIALAGAGFANAVAPMGTAMTEAQLERAWRVDGCPLLLFDGDDAGRGAAVKVAVRALPLIGPGKSLVAGYLPAGIDPDDLVQASIAAGEDPAMALAAWLMGHIQRIDQLLFAEAVAQSGVDDTRAPDAVAAIWHHLADYAAQIADETLRTTYLATWRARYEREYLGEGVLSSHPMAQRKAHLSGVWDETHQYFWPDPVDEGERQMIRFLREKLSIRAERRALTERNRDLDAMAKVIGLHPPTLNKVVADIEADPGDRETKEALWALYRRVAGVKGPMEVAILPSLIDGRAVRAPGVAAKRLAHVEAMIAGGV